MLGHQPKRASTDQMSSKAIVRQQKPAGIHPIGHVIRNGILSASMAKKAAARMIRTVLVFMEVILLVIMTH